MPKRRRGRSPEPPSGAASPAARRRIGTATSSLRVLSAPASSVHPGASPARRPPPAASSAASSSSRPPQRSQPAAKTASSSAARSRDSKSKGSKSKDKGKPKGGKPAKGQSKGDKPKKKRRRHGHNCPRGKRSREQQEWRDQRKDFRRRLKNLREFVERVPASVRRRQQQEEAQEAQEEEIQSDPETVASTETGDSQGDRDLQMMGEIFDDDLFTPGVLPWRTQ